MSSPVLPAAFQPLWLHPLTSFNLVHQSLVSSRVLSLQSAVLEETAESALNVAL